jgi:hypothetical protein
MSAAILIWDLGLRIWDLRQAWLSQCRDSFAQRRKAKTEGRKKEKTIEHRHIADACSCIQARVYKTI